MTAKELTKLGQFNKANNRKWHNMGEAYAEPPFCNLCGRDTTFETSVSHEGYCLICDRCIDVTLNMYKGRITKEQAHKAIKEAGLQMMNEENEALAKRHEAER